MSREFAPTREALEDGAGAIFEASFFQDSTFVAVDVLERTPEGTHLVEVKSSTKLKPEHVADVAVQLHVLRKAQVNVVRASLMHLNPDFRSPDQGDRFVIVDVTDEATEYLERVPDEI